MRLLCMDQVASLEERVNDLQESKHAMARQIAQMSVLKAKQSEFVAQVNPSAIDSSLLKQTSMLRKIK